LSKVAGIRSISVALAGGRFDKQIALPYTVRDEVAALAAVTAKTMAAAVSAYFMVLPKSIKNCQSN